MIRVLLVDDQPATRAGLRMRLALEPDIAVIGEACDGRAAVDLCVAESPDVVVMDVRMPELDGFAATVCLHERCPETGVVLLSLHDSEQVRAEAVAAGAVAFVGKHELDGPLLAAIRRAASSSAGASPTSHDS